MTASSTHLVLFIALTAALPALSAQAGPGSLAGEWRNIQTGTTFHITPERSGVFAVIRTRRDGKKERVTTMKATWVPGMRGSQFRFKKAVGTVGHGGKTIRFTKYTWSKVADYTAPGRQTGFWASDTGSVFLVTAAIGGQFHVLNFTKLGSFVSIGRWVDGMQGVQYRYKNGELVVTLNKDGAQAQLLNQRTNKRFAWTKVADWPGTEKSKPTP